MATVFVQFTDATETVIASVFGCPQDSSAYPNQAIVDSSDARYQAYINPSSTLSGAQAAQISILSAACQSAICAGFTSSALGVSHTYPSKMTDQQNLSASVISSLMPGLAPTWTTQFWCADTNGKWAWVNHTAAQIQQVGQDGKAAILAYMSKNAGFAEKVIAATTVAAVQAIIWI